MEADADGGRDRGGAAGKPRPPPEPADVDRADVRADFYMEGGLLVYTAAHHLKRGRCCGSGCRHCPYEPRHVEGATRVRPPGGGPL